jgi:hypothetical protein
VLAVSDCHLLMPKWELKSVKFDFSTICVGATTDQQALTCLAGMGVIPAGSLIVSGTIVFTGNTIRWLEYQGKCEEGVVNKSLVLLKVSGDEPISKDLWHKNDEF